MATENKGVMVYLPKEVEEYITEFCTEYNITRKDKEGNILPSLGTGVVTYLKSKISGESPGDVLAKPKSQSIGLTKSEVIDLINECFTSRSSSELPYNNSNSLSTALSKDEVLDLINQSVINSHLPQSIGVSDIENIVSGYVEKALAPIREEFASVRDELKAKEGQLDILPKAQIELLANQPSFVDSTSDKLPKEEREYLTFKQLATELDYPIPEGVGVKSPGKDNADTLIDFAATLGQSYGWDGKKQKLYRIEV